MRVSIVFGLATLCSLFMAVNVMAQGAPGGPGGRQGGGMFQPDPLQQILTALGDVNLRPDFTLTKEQKEKLQAIRDGVKKAEAKWRADNADALKKIQDDAAAARQAQDQDKAREAMTKRRELMQGMPKTEDAAKEVKALLTPEQAKALETRITEREQEMRDRMGGFGGGRGGRGGAGGAAQ